ncbi:MAG TPA: plastocyanin/azurin family copper-binding protein, partial [Planctomycetota bacterium]|nr:plastocyanin/azurin family copper-binding protein [Planctomycetota bacterium]
LADPEGQRVLAHVIGGSLLIVLPILALILSPLLRRSRFLAGFFSIVLIAVVGFQAWFGILLLFDSHHGPLWQFQSAGAVEEGEPPRGDEAPQPPAEPERDQVPPLVRGEGGERGERLPARENRRELDRRDFDPRDDEPVGGGDGASRRENDARATGERRGGLEDEPRNGDGAAPNANGGESRADAATAEASVVRMTNGREFDPKVITIRVGETIRWENPSQDVHTVTADPALAIFPEDVLLPEGVEPFDSGEIKPGGTWERTFDVPGRYRYFCIPHEQAGMTGEIIVEETPANGAGSESAGEAEGAEQAEE